MAGLRSLLQQTNEQASAKNNFEYDTPPRTSSRARFLFPQSLIVLLYAPIESTM